MLVKSLLAVSPILMLAAAPGTKESAAPAPWTVDVQSDGSDGAYNPLASETVQLGNAAAATWDTASPVAGNGVYDAALWAVVYKFSSVNIPAGVTVDFENHPSGAPVVWLVQGDVTIDGTVTVQGGDGFNLGGAGGPGGFAGGKGYAPFDVAGEGLGPGGGRTGTAGAGGTYATSGGVNSSAGTGPVYGNPEILPLIGGSGAGGDSDQNGGSGGGGGALLIAANGTVHCDGSLVADGGTVNFWHASGGSGGAIKVVASAMTGAGSLSAKGGLGYNWGGLGRIRIEVPAAGFSYTGSSIPVHSQAEPPAVPKLFPDNLDPRIGSVTLGGVPVPSDPNAITQFPNQDVLLPSSGTQQLVLQAFNVPLDWTVYARVVPRVGTGTTVNATLQGGNETLSTWTVDVPIPTGYATVEARAVAP